ncbi:MAG: exodeoxyribonuclease VII large subunit [Proteobacteria bacterium]|nr:exodeoxyribonuclease VII large subunit [Pseudomonadota bacterium]
MDLFEAATRQTTHGGGNEPLSVSQISNQLRLMVERSFARVAVQGEVSGLKAAASGHIYLNLKDSDAVLAAVIWRSAADKIRIALADGQEVVAYGKLTTYGARSSYQLVIDRVELAGQGALMARYEELRQQFIAEGLFDDARKKSVPYLPSVIGVVTSPTGDVIRDILHRLADRCPRRVLVWPTAVQGVGAKEGIAAAIAGFNNLPADGDTPRPDVIIVARGGGSLEDLWAFNEEIVVRAVAASAIPVISGVGHEPDYTLTDFAADLRAPTPTAAAELAVPVRGDLLYILSSWQTRMQGVMRKRIADSQRQIALMRRALPDPQRLIYDRSQKLDDRAERLHHAMRNRLAVRRQRLESITPRVNRSLLRRYFDARGEQLGFARKTMLAAVAKRLEHAQQVFAHTGKRLDRRLIDAPVKKHQAELARLFQLLHSYSPEGPLQRGYVYLTDGHKNVIKDADTSAVDVVVHFKNNKTRNAKLT